MSISEWIIKLIGVVLAIVGFALILSAVHIGLFGVSFEPWWAAILIGVGFLAAGIYIVRGGTVSL